jgi:hypothetical protein
MIYEDDFVCSYLTRILSNIRKIQKNNELDNSSNELLIEIKNCAKLAKKGACKMEKRLYLYRNTIESLGYERKK